MPRDEAAAILPAEPTDAEKKVRIALLEELAKWHDEQAASATTTKDLAWDEITANTAASLAAKRAFDKAVVSIGVHQACALYLRNLAKAETCTTTT